MNMKKFIITILLLLWVGFLGCSPAIFLGGIGTAVQAYVYWKEGEAHKYYKYDADIMYKATLRAIKKMDLTVTQDTVVAPKKSRKGSIPGHHLIATSNDRFKVKIFSTDKNVTEVSIRINFMGDKPYAELLYAYIDDQVNVIVFNENNKPPLVDREQKINKRARGR